MSTWYRDSVEELKKLLVNRSLSHHERFRRLEVVIRAIERMKADNRQGLPPRVLEREPLTQCAIEDEYDILLAYYRRFYLGGMEEREEDLIELFKGFLPSKLR